MTIEEKVFRYKRFDTMKMLNFGFRHDMQNKAVYTYEESFMNGEFIALLTVRDNKLVSGRVIDPGTGGEYLPLRFETADGAYVNTVRAAYEGLLYGLAARCCEDVVFASDQGNRIAKAIYKAYKTKPDFPWSEAPYDGAATFRHMENNKWYALLMNIPKDRLKNEDEKTMVDVLNLKKDTDDLPLYQKSGIYPAYHMNHQAWISVILDDTLSDKEIMELIAKSFDLTKKKPAK